MFLLKKRYWLLITALITLALVLKNAPATWVMYAAQQAAPNLQVSQVSGSLWQGEVAYAQWVQQGQALPLGKLQWHLAWSSLLRLRPCIDFSAIDSSQRIEGNTCYQLLGGTLTATDLDVTLPVARVAPFLSVDLDGQIDAYVKQMTWQDQRLGESNATVLWQNAAFYNGNQWLPVGDIQGQVNDDGRGGVDSQWQHVDNGQTVPLALDLNATLSQITSPKPQFTLNGIVTPGRGEQAFHQLLRLIAEPVSNGSYQIDIRE